MNNYEKVEQWASTISAESAFKELSELKAKYPWLKCDRSLELISTLSTALPLIVMIVKQQEKQNMIHRKYIEVSGWADDAIAKVIMHKYKIEL